MELVNRWQRGNSGKPAPPPAPAPPQVTRAVLDVYNVRWRTAELTASMFKAVKLKSASAGDAPVDAQSEAVTDDLDGQEFLLRVCDGDFIKKMGKDIPGKQPEDRSATTEQPSTIMQQYGFLPVGMVKDAGFGGKEALYVMVRGFDHSKVPPFVKNHIWNQILGIVGRHVKRRIPVVLIGVDSSVLNLALNFLYFNRDVPDDVEVETRAAEVLSTDVHNDDDDVIKNARMWLRVALFRRASDVHIEPMDGYGRIRLRIDGLLEPISEDKLPLADLNQMVTWIKASARMDISERRKPLDGGIRLTHTDDNVQRTVDVRISTVPTIYGQKMVLRLLDPNKLSRLAGKGLRGTIWDDGILACFEEILKSRDGIVLVTGPTGSGKTTTLNVALLHLLDRKVHGDRLNIVTIEDPVEYSIPGANQTQVNEAAGVTFSRTLRAFLRQDPDIMLVGEIRDAETAQVAVQAALTGHLILATLHTNDALGSVSRLKDLGISPFLIGATLRLVQAQRLVRRLCPNCGRRNPLKGDELVRKVNASRLKAHVDLFADPASTVYEPSKCTRCNNVGYEERIAVMEVATKSPELVAAIEQELPQRELERIARDKSGFQSMEEIGVKMICRGVTTLAEIETVTMQA